MLRKSWLSVAVALVVLLWCGTAWSASGQYAGVQQPVNIQQTAMGYYDGFLAPEPAASPSTSPAPAPAAPANVAACSAEPSCASGCGCCGCGGCGCGCCGGWSLPQPCCLSSRGIKIGGWLDQGITWNDANPDNRFNGPVATNDRDGEWEINQAWLWIDRPTNTGGCGWDLGGHMDIMWGTDWRYGIAYGLENNVNSLDQFYGWVFPQMFLELAYNDWKVRGGRFAGLLYYDRDQVPAVTNFFYSHSYTMAYAEPQLVTGMMVDYKISDQWLAQAGWDQGWYMWEDVNRYKDFMGALTWTSCDKRTKVKYALTTGNQLHLAQLNTKNWFAYDLVIQRQLSERWSYAFQHNLGYADNLVPGPNQTLRDAEWYSINQYLFYKINPKWEAGMRVEWFRDDDGGRVAGPATNPDYAGLRTWDGLGYAGSFTEVSIGLNWRPSKQFVLRPECRWDCYTGQRSWFNNTYPFGNGDKTHQFLFAVDGILTF